jgi:hypothetical protein
MALPITFAISNVAKSGDAKSNYILTQFISALGAENETIYAAILKYAPTLSGDAPPTEANLQSRVAATQPRLKADGDG